MELYIARNKRTYIHYKLDPEEPELEIYGKLCIYFKKPQLSPDGRWVGKMLIRVPAYMYPDIKENECRVISQEHGITALRIYIRRYENLEDPVTESWDVPNRIGVYYDSVTPDKYGTIGSRKIGVLPPEMYPELKECQNMTLYIHKQ